MKTHPNLKTRSAIDTIAKAFITRARAKKTFKIQGDVYTTDPDALTITFPERLLSDSRPDATCLLHEIGHFIERPAEKVVLPAFGFSFGTPFLTSVTSEPLREFTKLSSADSEAFAAATAIVCARDLFGIDLDANAETDSFSYLADFHLFPGSTKEEKLIWVADLTRQKVAEIGTYEDIFQLFVARLELLPQLFERQNKIDHFLCKLDALNPPADAIFSGPISGNKRWIAIVARIPDIEHLMPAFCVTITNTHTFTTHERTFKTAEAAFLHLEKTAGMAGSRYAKAMRSEIDQQLIGQGVPILVEGDCVPRLLH